MPTFNPESSHLVELTLEAFRIATSAATAAAEGIATVNASAFNVVRSRERELDGLDRDLDDLVTTTITKVDELQARELLACLKFMISLERIGDLLLSFVNRAEIVGNKIDAQDTKELTIMATRLEKMLTDVDEAFRKRSLDLAVGVLRADAEMDRFCNLLMFRHLEQNCVDNRLESFHVLFMAQELERAGDHAKNMAEEVCHLISGRTVRHVLRAYDRPIEQMFIEFMRKQDSEESD